MVMAEVNKDRSNDSKSDCNEKGDDMIGISRQNLKPKYRRLTAVNTLNSIGIISQPENTLARYTTVFFYPTGNKNRINR